MQFRFRFVSQAQQAVGVGQQLVARRRKHEAAPLPMEQPLPEPLFQLPDARGDVRLHAVELVGRAHHAALGDNGAEVFQRVQINGSHKKKDSSE